MPDQIFDFGHVLVRHFDAAPRGDFHVEGELAGVGLREEGPAEKRINRQARRRRCPGARPGSGRDA